MLILYFFSFFYMAYIPYHFSAQKQKHARQLGHKNLGLTRDMVQYYLSNLPKYEANILKIYNK